MYHPLQNTCMNSEVTISKRDKEALYGVKNSPILAPGVTDLGTLQAFSLETGKTVWTHSQRAAMTSVVATGGGLIFGGDAAGKFRAFDAASGAVLWETNLGAPVTGYPVSFAANGRQYVAVSTGYSVTTMCLLRLTPEVKPGDEHRLFVFALPE
jgi:alcohol dehydrogenase (cytochrome c)